MTAPARTAAVVVTHDSRDDVLACVAGLPAAGADELVVVDSGSVDGTAAAVRRRFPEVTVVELGNVGYGRAANAGVAATSADVVVVANADARFAPEAVTRLAAALEAHPEAGAVGPLVRYPDGRVQASARRFPTLAQAVGHAALGLWWSGNPWTRRYLARDHDPLSPREVDWLSGCAIGLRRRAFLDVGGFDPGYFMFVEDVDLSYRLWRSGWHVRVEPAAEVVHAVGGATRRRRAAMVVEHARSLDRFCSRTYADGHRRWLRPVVRAGLAGWVLATLARDATERMRRGP